MLENDDTTKDFMKTKKRELVNGDLKSQRGTLSEIIAYYYLSEAGFKVEYQKKNNTPTADYMITSPEGEKAIVEVTCRGLCDNAQNLITGKKLDRQLKTKMSIEGPTIIKTYGYSNDSSTADAISKICSMKNEEHQLSDNLPSILWADFGVTGDYLTLLGLLYPLNSSKGCVTSGHLWYGFYGKKVCQYILIFLLITKII